MIETTKLFILISVWMTMTFIQGHTCVRKTLVSFFFILTEVLHSTGWMKCSMLAQVVGLLKLMLSLFYASSIPGRELCWHLKNYSFNSDMDQKTCELMCCKLGVKPNTTNVHSLIQIWLTLIFIQGVGRTCAVILFMTIDYVREKTVKKSPEYGEYGLLEHLLFSFFVFEHEHVAHLTV